MRSRPQKTVILFTLWIILLLLLSACGRSPAAMPAATATPASPPPPTEDWSGLSPGAIATLRSLEKVDDHPLYVMRYTGRYDDHATGWTWPRGSAFSCSLFVVLGQAGDMVYGRNFDWEFSPALLLFTDPPDGYASVSMVDLTYLGIDPANATSLTDLPLTERSALLAAPTMPFDGMNLYGLTIAMAAVPDALPSNARRDPSKPTIGSIGIIREILDHARSVDEAVPLFERYNIDFTGGPTLHYLLADPGGAAVLVEFCEGEMVVLPNEAPWHMATNHLRCSAAGDGGCERYRTISERLAATNGQMHAQAAMQLLSEVAQSGTQWSVVYNVTSGDVDVTVGHSYSTVFPFHLDRVRP